MAPSALSQSFLSYSSLLQVGEVASLLTPLPSLTVGKSAMRLCYGLYFSKQSKNYCKYNNKFTNNKEKIKMFFSHDHRKGLPKYHTCLFQ